MRFIGLIAALMIGLTFVGRSLAFQTASTSPADEPSPTPAELVDTAIASVPDEPTPTPDPMVAAPPRLVDATAAASPRPVPLPDSPAPAVRATGATGFGSAPRIRTAGPREMAPPGSPGRVTYDLESRDDDTVTYRASGGGARVPSRITYRVAADGSLEAPTYEYDRTAPGARAPRGIASSPFAGGPVVPGSPSSFGLRTKPGATASNVPGSRRVHGGLATLPGDSTPADVDPIAEPPSGAPRATGRAFGGSPRVARVGSGRRTPFDRSAEAEATPPAPTRNFSGGGGTVYPRSTRTTSRRVGGEAELRAEVETLRREVIDLRLEVDSLRRLWRGSNDRSTNPRRR